MYWSILFIHEYLVNVLIQQAAFKQLYSVY